MSARGLVVAGYQGGQEGQDALAFARRWAATGGDQLLVVTVHPGAAPPGVQRVDAEWAAYERSEVSRLQDEARALVPGNATLRAVESASAAHGLHDLLERSTSSTPLLVLGSRRGRELRRTFPGSTAERMLQGSSWPVAIVPWRYADSVGLTAPDDPLRRLTVAYVATPDGEVALDHAVAMAAHLSAELRLLSILPPTEVVPSVGEPRRFAEGQREDYQRSLDAAAARAADTGVSVTAELREGPVVEALAEVGPDQADVLVCGSRSYGPIRRVLVGGVSSRVVRHARVPVVVVPRGAHGLSAADATVAP